MKLSGKKKRYPLWWKFYLQIIFVEDLITALRKVVASEKERNLPLDKKKELKVYEVGGVKPSYSPGNSDNKVDKLVSASFNSAV